jgi:uncharacterized protein with HEPN domain
MSVATVVAMVADGMTNDEILAEHPDLTQEDIRERPLRLAGEAVIGRVGDIATKLPDEVTEATPEIPWRKVKG